MDEEERNLYNSLISAIQSGDKKRIDKAKYDFLFFGSSLFDVVPNYMVLTDYGIDFNFGCINLKKGTKLYRVRRHESNIDFSNPSEWNYPPLMPENRANKKGEPALYLGTTENICALETHIKHGQKYVLGEYIVTEDIKLGGFLNCEDRTKLSWYLAGVILNAFLIAPSRSDKNDDLFNFLDNIYGNVQLKDLNIKESNKLDLPLKFGVLNKKTNFYGLTNKLIKHIKNKYPEGLFYSSCYVPLSTVDIICSDSNIVLYESGMKKIEFVGASDRVKINEKTGIDFLKAVINLTKKQKNLEELGVLKNGRVITKVRESNK